MLLHASDMVSGSEYDHSCRNVSVQACVPSCECSVFRFSQMLCIINVNDRIYIYICHIYIESLLVI